MSGIDVFGARNGAYGSLPQQNYKDKSDDDGLPPWFNGDIPQDYSNFYGDPNDSIGGKLRRMIQYMETHKASLATQQKFLEYVANLSKAGEFKDHPQLLKTLEDLKDPSGKSIVEKAIDVLMEKAFYEGGESGMREELQQLRQMFAGAGEPISTEAGNELDDWNRRIPDFVKQNTDPKTGKPYITDPEDYEPLIASSWGLFFDRLDYKSWEKDTRMSMYDEIVKECKNPLVAAMILLAMLNESDSAGSIAGLGDTSSWLDDRSHDVSDILSGFHHFDTPAEAKAWMDKLEQLLWKGDYDPRSGDLGGLIDSNAGGILNMPSGEQGPDGELTLEQLARGYTDKEGNYHEPDLGKLQNSLNSMLPDSDRSKPVPTQYQTILNHLNSLGAAVSDQSQTVTTQVSQLSKFMQAMENFLNKVLNDNSSGVAGLVNNAVSNQKA